MMNLFVTVYGTELDKQHVGSFKTNSAVKKAMDKMTKSLFKEYKHADMMCFVVTGNGEDEFYTKNRPETGAFANIPVMKEVHLRNELIDLNLKLVDNAKATDFVKEIEAKNLTIKQWAKKNSKKVTKI